MTVSIPAPSGPLAGMIAPLSGQSLGLQRAQVTNGIREVSKFTYIYITGSYDVHYSSCIIVVNVMQR